MAHTVELEQDRSPVFPDRCVVCGQEQPSEGVELSSMFNPVKPLDEEVFALHRARVPACAACIPKLRRSRWLGKLAIGVALAVSLALIVALVQLELSFLGGWIDYLVLAVILIVPFAIATAVYVPYFDFGPYDRRVMYDFRDRAYAEQFCELSGGRMR